MKKLLLIPALLAGSLALADQKKYEISPMIGYNFAEGNLNVKDDAYPVGGLELQFNTPDSKISPEFSILYSQGVDYKSHTDAKYKPGQDTKVARGAFNGVYTFDAMSAVVPFAKLGGGIEKISNRNYSVDNGFFFDAGAGAKVPFTENIALKLEAIYMAKIGTNNAGFADSNLVTMIGLTFAFGDQKAKEAPKPVVVKEVAKKEPVKAAPVAAVVAAPVIIDGDDDNDGVLNSVDTCPKTVAGVKVDTKGCNADLDNDGILNENDSCPNTVAGDAVNSDGCPKAIALQVNFENNSDTIKAESEAQIALFADFLKKYSNYSAKIIGYTDSRGSASYNQKLSEKRANAVVSDLVSRGVDAKQLSAVGKGENNPIADNATAKGRAQNRRIVAEVTRN